MNIIHFLIGKAKPESKNGIVKVVYYLAKHQAQLGHNVEVWSATDRVGEETKEGFINRYFKRGPIGFMLHPLLRESFKRLMSGDVIVHLHGNYIPEHVSITRILKKNKIPYVVSCHGILSPYAHRRGYLKKLLFKHLFELSILRSAARIHALGEREAENISRYGVDKRKIFIIPNGIDIITCPKAEPLGYVGNPKQNAKDTKTILYIGRLEPFIKGLDLLIKGFAIACKKRSDLRLIIVGPDHNGGLDYLKHLILYEGISEKVYLLPAVYGSEKFNLMSRADLYAQPSRSEGMPVGVLEALAYSIPCLVTRETNIGDYVDKYNAGFVVSLNTRDISDAIFRAFSDADLVKMGQNARKLVETEFVWKNIAEQFCECYKKLTG